MSWVFLDGIRDWLRRKPKPVTYLDIEVRDVDGSMRTAYRVGDGPVVVSPWYSASCQKGS